jgi:exosortase
MIPCEMSENAEAEPLSNAATPSSKPGFMEEFAEVWARLPHKALFAILFIAWVALFHYYGNATFGYSKDPSLWGWLNEDYIGVEDDAHGRYVPFVVLIFFWIKRKELLAAMDRIWWPAAIYFAFAVALHVMAYRVQQTRISVLAFILGFHALLGVIWGKKWLLRTAFPVFLLLFSIPFGSIASIISVDLRVFVTKIAVTITHTLLGIPVFADGTRVVDMKTGNGLYEVAPACSGMRSLTALTALSVIYAFLNFDKGWQRVVLVTAGIPLAVIANVTRISTVIIVGDTISRKVAAMIEQKFGFLTFLVAIAGMMIVGWVIDRKPRQAAPKIELPEGQVAV